MLLRHGVLGIKPLKPNILTTTARTKSQAGLVLDRATVERLRNLNQTVEKKIITSGGVLNSYRKNSLSK